MNKKQIAITLGIVCLILTMFVVIQIRTTNNANKVVSQTFTSNDLRDQVLKWKEYINWINRCYRRRCYCNTKRQ